MTTPPVELTPPTNPITVVTRPLRRWDLANTRDFGSAIHRRLQWQVMPTAVQFVLLSLLAAVVVLGSISALLALFDAWYGPLLAPAMRGLGF